MQAIPVTAIFDIGKTNKKLFLFDDQYNVLYEKTEVFPETKDDDGDPCEDLAMLTEWIKKSLQTVALIKKFELKAINFSAYGASFVHIDRENRPVAPLYNYLKPYPESLKKEFYKKYGGEVVFSMNTASPPLGNLNSGLLLYLLKHEKPEIFSKIRYSLHLPQYLSSLVTKRSYSDITSIGCHTGLWNFPENRYHDWVHQEGISSKLAPIFPSDQIIRSDFNKKPLMSGVGLHDSSSALIPYLSNFTEPFVLISTGTWCISLNPFNQASLTAEELQQDCLCYMEYRGKPIKASRLFAGHEHEQQVKRIAEHFQLQRDYYKKVDFDSTLISKLSPGNLHLKSESGQSIDLTNSGFAKKELSSFDSYEEAYHQLMVDIVNQQVHSTNLILNHSQTKKIFVDGGFSNNSIYTSLLAMAFPDIEVYAASISQASALGAAMAIHHYWNKQPSPSNLVRLKKFKPALESHS